jgi:hypothetical protein
MDRKRWINTEDHKLWAQSSVSPVTPSILTLFSSFVFSFLKVIMYTGL